MQSTEALEPVGVLQEVKTALTEWYTFLCGMPHFPPNALELPPLDGWPESDLDVETLKARGKSDTAIEFLRRIPYIGPCTNSDRAWITHGSIALNIHRGETWLDWDEIGEIYIPPHVVLIGDSQDCAAVHILLDTDTGRMIEYEPFDCPRNMGVEEYDSLPRQEKWKAHPALPAREFFNRERLWYTHLICIPVPVRTGWPRFYSRGSRPDQRDEILAVQDEYEADHEDDPDYMDVEEFREHQGANDENNGQDVEMERLRLHSSDSESDLSMDEESEIPTEELEGLEADSVGAVYQPSGGGGVWTPWEIDDDARRVYEIYKRNGWPYAQFKIEQCRAELLVAQTEIEGKREAENKVRWEAKKKEQEALIQASRQLGVESGQ